MGQSPYPLVDDKPELRYSVVAFLDVLGFQEIARAAERAGAAQDLLCRLRTALTDAHQHLDDSTLPGSDLWPSRLSVVKAFTDNIVIGYPIRTNAESELGSMMRQVSWYQFSMVLAGFFVRGAISIGDLFVDDLMVFGDGLLDAHHGEANLARDPRIILTPSAVEAIREHIRYYQEPSSAPQCDDLVQDADGQWFVNYLDVVICAVPEHAPFYDELRKHKEIVEGRLVEFRSQPSIFSKYAWVAGYHNWWCSQHSHYFDEKYKIPLNLFEAPMKRIA
jgi:hypothetical protein